MSTNPAGGPGNRRLLLPGGTMENNQRRRLSNDRWSTNKIIQCGRKGLKIG